MVIVWALEEVGWKETKVVGVDWIEEVVDLSKNFGNMD